MVTPLKNSFNLVNSQQWHVVTCDFYNKH